MSMVKRSLVVVMGLVLLAGLVGCKDEVEKTGSKQTLTESIPEQVVTDTEAVDLSKVCPKCGFIKGTAECCNVEGKGKCVKCGLVKGSPGCCKLGK